MTDYVDDLEIARLNRHSTRSLRLKKQTLDGMPAEIAEFSNLLCLDMSRGSYAAFPGPVGINKGLERLLVSRSCISTITEEIGAYSALIELDLAWNEFTYLPASLGRLANLEILNLGHSPLQELPATISALESLVSVNVAGTDLGALPVGMGDLKKLEELNANKAKLLQLPASLARLKGLKTLYLADNQLRSLPTGLHKLSELVDVDLSGNNLQALAPGFFGPRGWQALKALSLANNESLEIADVLPPLEAHQNLRRLDLSRIDHEKAGRHWALPPNLADLRWRHGGFQSCPTPISALRQLESLDLAFANISDFPGDLASKNSLKKLDLSANALQKLPADIGDFKSLEVLRLGANNLQELPPLNSGWPALKELDLSFNPIRRLPDSLGKKGALEVIDLEQNEIDHYDQIGPALQGCHNLKRVKLVGNPITLDRASCERLRQEFPNCQWEMRPAGALHRVLARARQKLSVGDVEAARHELDDIARFEGNGGEDEEFMAHQVRQNARALLAEVGR